MSKRKSPWNLGLKIPRAYGFAGGGLRFVITNLPSIIGFDKIGWCEKSLLGACPTSILGLD